MTATTFEVMDRNTDRSHSEHTTRAAAVAVAKTLVMAEVVTDDGAVSVFSHGGRECPGCGCFAPHKAFNRRGECDGCEESARDDENFRRENAADFDFAI